jgi:hypothetical protein
MLVTRQGHRPRQGFQTDYPQANGPFIQATVAGIGIKPSSSRITEIFDSDLPANRSWRKEISDGDYVYEIRNGDQVPIRAESPGKIGIDVTFIVIRVKIEYDLFRQIFGE